MLATLYEAANTKLHQAAAQGSEQAIAQAISEGADVCYLDPAQNTTALHLAAKAGAVRAVELLVRANADVNTVNSVNATPLVYAAQKGHVDVVQALLALGANKDILTRVRCARARGRGRRDPDAKSRASLAARRPFFVARRADCARHHLRAARLPLCSRC